MEISSTSMPRLGRSPRKSNQKTKRLRSRYSFHPLPRSDRLFCQKRRTCFLPGYRCLGGVYAPRRRPRGNSGTVRSKGTGPLKDFVHPFLPFRTTSRTFAKRQRIPTRLPVANRNRQRFLIQFPSASLGSSIFL